MWRLLMATLMTAPLAHAACGEAAIVRDMGLHRAWRVSGDCAHPERPAVLVEVPWAAVVERIPAVHPGTPQQSPLVQAGARVSLTWQGGKARGTLAGTALATAGMGEVVAVRSGVGQRILWAVVCGPGRVELEAGKAEP